MKLDERDRRTLALLGSWPRSVTTLASHLGVDAGALDDRLAELADNGLVVARGDGRYERTESGRRVLLTAHGTANDRIDTSPAVERALDGLGLGPEETDAVRKSFLFLRYWGRATAAEIADAIYPEAPAGRETPAEWWEGLVRDALPTLPDVVSPSTPDDPWRYAGSPEVDGLFADGRRVLSKRHPVYGDVKHAVASLDLSAAEREAASVAFGHLYRRGSATERDLSGAVFSDHSAGYASAADWWDGFLRATFEALPGVERVDDGWRYRHP